MYSTIRLYIIDNIINNVIDNDFVVVIWDKLEKLYLVKSLANKLYLKHKLYRLRMEEGEDFRTYSNEYWINKRKLM